MVDYYDEDTFKPEYLTNVFRALVCVEDTNIRVKQIHLALRIARRMKNYPFKSMALCEIARLIESVEDSFVRTKLFDQLINTTMEIDAYVFRIEALTEIALLLKKIGESNLSEDVFLKAIQTADRIDKDYEKDSILAVESLSLSKLTQALAKAGKYDQALTFSKRIKDINEKDRTHFKIVQMLVETGELELARRIIEDIHYDRLRFLALSYVYAQEGKLQEALSQVKLIEGRGPEEFESLYNISMKYLHQGDIKQSLDIAAQADDWRLNNKFKFNQLIEAIIELEDSYEREKLLSQVLIIAEAQKYSRIFDVIDLLVKAKEFSPFRNFIKNTPVSFSKKERIINSWRDSLIKYLEDPLALLRESLGYYPFNIELAYLGVLSLLINHQKKGNCQVLKSTSQLCPQLELDYLLN